jgi:hypothetical protein
MKARFKNPKRAFRRVMRDIIQVHYGDGYALNNHRPKHISAIDGHIYCTVDLSLNSRITIACDAKVLREGGVTVMKDSLLTFLAYSTDGGSIEAEDGFGLLTFTDLSDEASRTYNSTPGNIIFPPLLGENPPEVPSNELAKALRVALTCTKRPGNNVDIAHYNVAFRMDNYLHVYAATDRLYGIDSIPLQTKAEVPIETVVPTWVARTIRGMCYDKVPIRFHLGDTILFGTTTSEASVYFSWAKDSPEDFPTATHPYPPVFDTLQNNWNSQISAILRTSSTGLLEVLKNCKSDHRARFFVSKDTVAVHAGERIYPIRCEHNGYDSYVTAVDSRQLVKALRMFAGEDIRIGFNGTSNPVILTNMPGTTTFLVSPVMDWATG